LLHDIAKPFVREKIKGEFRFYDHEKIGALMAKDIMRRLKFSRESIKRVSHLISLHMIGYESSWNDSAVRRFVRRVGIENVDAIINLRKADLIAHGIMDNKIEKATELEQRVKELTSKSLEKGLKGLAIDGNKVMEILHIKEGPAVGAILDELMDRVIECPELNNPSDLIPIMKSMRNGD
jgi:poly(A) polymerase/tRNA nucleotidyltransferase (CCA-adding enzyme)